MDYGREINPKQQYPFLVGYCPEVNTLPELDEENTNCFQGLVGMLRWSIEISRAEIDVEVSLLLRHLDSPRGGHLYQTFDILAYLNQHPHSNLLMIPECMYLGEQFKSRFKINIEWFEFYGDVI